MRTIQIDTTLQSPTFPATGATIAWRETLRQEVNGEQRYYYAAEAPWRILLVLRGAPIDADLWTPSSIVNGLVGWDDGTAGFVLPDNERRRHTKLTLLADLPTAIMLNEVESLCHILFRAPRSDRRGGYRGTQGRPSLDQTGTHQACTTLTGDQHAFVLDLGQGDVASGLRAAVQVAMEQDHDSQS